MNANFLSLILLPFVLVLSACSPAAVATSSGEQPAPGAVNEPASSGTQPVIVQNVEVATGIGSPLPVEVVVSGTWPSLCSQIADVRSSSDDFNIDISIQASMQASCPPDNVGLTFRFALPLNIVEMEEGTYTISVNGISTTFKLPEDLNKGTGAIFGWVWHDQCDSGQDGQPAPASTPPGCVEEASAIGPYHANGLLDSASGTNEEPIEGVTVRLFEGDCASAVLNQVAETQTIATDISYSFTDLRPGTYCVSIDPQEDVNLSILRPGIWTYPRVSQADINQTVTLQPQEAKYDVNFGWDYQFK